MIGPTTSRSVRAMAASGSTLTGKSTLMTSRSSSTMTTARAASSATLSVASVPRRAVVLRRVVLRRVVLQEVEVQEEAHREAFRQGLHRESQAVVAVAPAAMMTTITIRLAAVVEGVGDDVLWDTLRVEIYQKS